MHLYLVIVDAENPNVLDPIPQEKRCEIRDRVWFVVSDLPSTAELSEHLGIEGDKPGIVVGAKFYAGFTENRIIERLRTWNV